MHKGELIKISYHTIIILVIMTAVLTMQIKNKKISECEITFPQIVGIIERLSSIISIQIVEPIEMQNVEKEEINLEYDMVVEVEQTKEKEFKITLQERYELAKLIMCEAEGEGDLTKALIVFVIFNRVKNDCFPNSIHDVIFEEHRGAYQFSPLSQDGSWYEKEPNDDCYRVVDMIIAGEIEDTSDGALYFEACLNSDNWHSRNLEYLFDSDNTRFYR